MINPYFDTAIGVAVIFLIFSVLAYVIQEFWAALRESRGKMLKKAIYDLLNDKINKDFGVLLFDQPQFNFLKKTDNKLPSYLPSSNFADGLIDLISREAYDLHFSADKVTVVIKDEEIAKGLSSVNSKDVKDFLPDQTQTFILFRAGLAQLKTSNLKQLLQNILANSTDLASLRSNIETWYNDYMDRVTGWYKSKVRVNLRFVGIALAIIFNLHAFYMIGSIYSDRQLRDKLVKTGETFVNNEENFLVSAYTSSLNSSLGGIDADCNRRLQQLDSLTSDSASALRSKIEKECLSKRVEMADSFATLRRQQAKMITDSLKLWDLPIGWQLFGEPGTASEATGATQPRRPFPGKNYIWILIGWLASGLAISSGAPFWFNVLNKFFNLRRAGIKPDENVKIKSGL